MRFDCIHCRKATTKPQSVKGAFLRMLTSIPIQDYYNLDYKGLAYILWHNMFHLWYDRKQDSLLSVVGDEYVFKDKPEKLEALKVLEDEVYKINKDLGNIA